MSAYNVITRTSMAAGQPEDVSVVLANFDALAVVINGNIDHTNINAGSTLSVASLTLSQNNATAIRLTGAAAGITVGGDSSIYRFGVAQLATENLRVTGGNLYFPNNQLFEYAANQLKLSSLIFTGNLFNSAAITAGAYGGANGALVLSPANPNPTGAQAVGNFVVYVDGADNKLKARGSGGTVTILASA